MISAMQDLYLFLMHRTIEALVKLSQEEQRKKKKKRQLLLEENTADQNVLEVNSVLEELEKEKKYLDIQVCPKCRSPRIRRVGSMKGDTSGHMGLLPPKFECTDCGWQERLVLKATNRKDSLKNIAIIAEALDPENNQNR